MQYPAQPLTHAQLEILRAFSHELSGTELEEFRDVIAQFFGKRAIELANKAWDENGWSEEDMEKLLNTKMSG